MRTPPLCAGFHLNQTVWPAPLSGKWIGSHGWKVAPTVVNVAVALVPVPRDVASAKWSMWG